MRRPDAPLCPGSDPRALCSQGWLRVPRDQPPGFVSDASAHPLSNSPPLSGGIFGWLTGEADDGFGFGRAAERQRAPLSIRRPPSSESHDLVGASHQVDESVRVDHHRVLSFKVLDQDPSSFRSTPSKEDRDSKLGAPLQQRGRVRLPRRLRARGDFVLHEHRRVAGEKDDGVVALLFCSDGEAQRQNCSMRSIRRALRMKQQPLRLRLCGPPWDPNRSRLRP